MASFMSVKQFAAETGWDVKIVYDYARDPIDPLPIRYVKNRSRGGILIVEEAAEWVQRNSRLYLEKG